jgi:O-acetyl-ADP-ribose deacetylase (regulator of RNase III)
LIAFNLGPLALEIVEGDITAQTTDAVVNAANSALWMGGGVAGAIKARGGAEIEAAAMAQGPVEPGECVVTSAGRLPARFVIHAAVMGQDLRTSADLIERALVNVVGTAKALGVTSIACPALGTGVGRFPVPECARISIDVVRGQAASAAPLRLVRLVLFGQPAYRAFVEAATDVLGAPLEGPPDCPLSG